VTLLRLTERSHQDQHQIDICLELPDGTQQAAVSHFDFTFGPEDESQIRWYLEDYLQYPQDPAPLLAARIERRMSELGMQLFRCVFQSTDQAASVLASLHGRLSDTRVEIITPVREAFVLPWELLQDPETGARLALLQ